VRPSPPPEKTRGWRATRAESERVTVHHIKHTPWSLDAAFREPTASGEQQPQLVGQSLSLSDAALVPWACPQPA
jgi:hypothetical protein